MKKLSSSEGRKKGAHIVSDDDDYDEHGMMARVEGANVPRDVKRGRLFSRGYWPSTSLKRTSGADVGKDSLYVL